MADDHTVKEGDCIASLAYERGLSWQKVWNHPLNAALKTQRQDPNILKPGDIVHLPDKQLKTVDRPTDQLHEFVLEGVPAKLRLRILQGGQPQASPQNPKPTDISQHFSDEDPDTSGKSEQQTPRADVPYVLVIDGNLRDGETDENGMVELSIPPNARRGRLVLEPGTLRETVFDLNLGWLDPADSVSGIKQRLANLGVNCGDQSNEVTPGFQDALRVFQESRGLQVTGVADDATRTQLKLEHGS
jgi:hypothetical protein